jgi:uroporphyrinogen III methyltransferase / synthase
VTVYLVGTGPGDPGLLTARALELIGGAEVIIHDRLVPDEALARAPANAQLIDVGKQGGGPSASQSDINRLLVEHGGRAVVRLKGGDPFVFGRGGEEVEALARAGVPFEVVPGVTAGVAAPAYAGIPVTHRGLASGVALVTGHEDPEKPEQSLDWPALAAFPGTLVIYMGVRQLEAIARRLMAAGRDPAEPAVVIERGTLPDQRVLEGTLATLPGLGARAPAIVVIGRVAEPGRWGAWFEHRPLSGVRVAVTRARAQASDLVSRLRSLGATVIEAPAIRIAPADFVLPDLRRYDLLCLTSPNGVRLLFEGMESAGLDARALAGLKVAAIGPGTAAQLRSRGIVADVVPERFLAEGLVEALEGVPVKHALLARARQARDVLEQALRARGTDVDVLVLYETVADPLTAAQSEALAEADYVTFTSSSTVQFLIQSLGETDGLATQRLVSIGPVTSQALRQHGLEPHVEASQHDIEGLVEALVTDAQGRKHAAPDARS